MEAAATPAERAALFAGSKCSAIDDESNSVACLAQARDIPFAVLRAVSDDANASLPMAARHATNPDGRANIQSVLEALRRPGASCAGAGRARCDLR
jgi:nucleoside phosphorylase